MLGFFPVTLRCPSSLNLTPSFSLNFSLEYRTSKTDILNCLLSEETLERRLTKICFSN